MCISNICNDLVPGELVSVDVSWNDSKIIVVVVSVTPEVVPPIIPARATGFSALAITKSSGVSFIFSSFKRENSSPELACRIWIVFLGICLALVLILLVLQPPMGDVKFNELFWVYSTNQRPFQGIPYCLWPHVWR